MASMDERQARELASHWIQAWNSHDLDAIMEHYKDEVLLTSPVAARVVANYSGAGPLAGLTFAVG